MRSEPIALASGRSFGQVKPRNHLWSSSPTRCAFPRHAPMSLRAAILRSKRVDASPPLAATASESVEDGHIAGDGLDDQARLKRAGATFLVRRMSDPSSAAGEGSASPLAVNPFNSLEWWVSPMRVAFMHRFEGLRFSRPFKVESVCTGLGTEFFALKALGVPFTALAASDPKPTAQTWLQRQHPYISHMYNTMQGQSCKRGCLLHGDLCSAKLVQPDILVGGPPCQPYSDARPGRYTSARPEHHKLFPTIFDESPDSGGSFLNILKRLQPLGFVLEEVPGFSKMCRGEMISALDKFVERVKSFVRPDGRGPLFPGVVVVRQDGLPWLDLPRERLREGGRGRGQWRRTMCLFASSLRN